MDTDGWKIAIFQQARELLGSLRFGYKYDNLVELEGIKEISEFTVFGGLVELNIVLSETMKSKLGVVVYENLLGAIDTELTANWADLRVQSSRVHHDLFLLWGSHENFLNIASHVEFREHDIALVENEVFDVG